MKPGTIWMTYGETLENQDATVGFSQYDDGRRLGEYAGQWITENLGGNAKVAILGYDLATWGRLRGGGIEDGLLAIRPERRHRCQNRMRSRRPRVWIRRAPSCRRTQR